MKQIITVLLLLLMISCGSQQTKEEKGVISYAKENDFRIKGNDVENADPAILFCYAKSLYDKGEKDEAVFWYYVAQYRYRILVSCTKYPNAGSFSEEYGKKVLVKTGVYNEDNIDNLHLIGGIYRIELYETIQAILGKTINWYAYSDQKQMESMLDRLLQYCADKPFNPQGLSPKPILKEQAIVDEKLKDVAESYREQKAQLIDEADGIKAERAKVNQENRN